MKLFSGVCIALAGSTTAAARGGYNSELYRAEQNQDRYGSELNRNDFINDEQNQKSFGQSANRQFQKCSGFERCNTICDEQSARNRSFDTNHCTKRCFQENIMCDPDIQGTVNAVVSSIRSGAQPNQFRNDGQQNGQCMQQCQLQCQTRPQTRPQPQPGFPPREIENGQPARGQGGYQPREVENGQGGQQWGQGGQQRGRVGQQRGQGGQQWGQGGRKLVVNIARGAHSSGGEINVFVDDNFAGSLSSRDRIAHGGERYELDLPQATGAGVIKLQASSTNGVHVSNVQYQGQTVASDFIMDENKDPKYQYCPCDRYDSQCTHSQHFRAIQFSDRTGQVNGAACAQSGNGQQQRDPQRPRQRQNGWAQSGQGNGWAQAGQGNGYQPGRGQGQGEPQGGQYGQNRLRAGQSPYGQVRGQPNLGNKAYTNY